MKDLGDARELARTMVELGNDAACVQVLSSPGWTHRWD